MTQQEKSHNLFEQALVEAITVFGKKRFLKMIENLAKLEESKKSTWERYNPPVVFIRGDKHE